MGLFSNFIQNFVLDQGKNHFKRYCRYCPFSIMKKLSWLISTLRVVSLRYDYFTNNLFVSNCTKTGKEGVTAVLLSHWIKKYNEVRNVENRESVKIFARP